MESAIEKVYTHEEFISMLEEGKVKCRQDLDWKMIQLENDKEGMELLQKQYDDHIAKLDAEKERRVRH